MSRSFATAPAFVTKRLALAGFLAVAGLTSAASAADCVNGYRTVGNQVIVLCDGAADAFGSTALYNATPESAAPIGVAPPPPSAASSAPRNLIAGSPQDCQPGQYWGFQMVESGDMLIAC